MSQSLVSVLSDCSLVWSGLGWEENGMTYGITTGEVIMFVLQVLKRNLYYSDFTESDPGNAAPILTALSEHLRETPPNFSNYPVREPLRGLPGEGSE